MRINPRKEDCCGCAACAQVCPQNAIKMITDDEGFLYPSVDEELCVRCRRCKNLCPVLNPVQKPTQQPVSYIVQNKDETIRRESTSGGAFTNIAEYVIELGGTVWGVCLDEHFEVCHKSAESKEELAAFRGSKYCQSNLKDTFLEVLQVLKSGAWALFSGTPCQIEGLLRYLGADYERLITVDVVCRGVPSPKVFEKYMAYQKQQVGKFDRLVFRDKYKGYTHTTMSLYQANKCLYHNGLEFDPMLKLYFKSLISRPSCGECSFKKLNRASDFTLWDCFDAGDWDGSFNDNKGTSNMMIHTAKGQSLFNEIKIRLKYMQTDPAIVCSRSAEMTKSISPNPARQDFFADLNQMEPNELFQKWCPITMAVRLEKLARNIFARLHLYYFVKKLRQKINR